MQRSVKPKLNLLVALWCCATTVSGQVAPSPMEENLVDKIWEAVGGQENWQNARYFMFSCTGGSHSFAQGERKYLWDKQTGEDRKSVVEGKRVSVRVELGGRRSI